MPDADVAYQPETGLSGADLNPGISIDTDKVQVPVVIDVLRKPGHKSRAMGETLVGVAKTDGRNAVLYGPGINGGEPVTLGPDCRPLEPGAETPGK